MPSPGPWLQLVAPEIVGTQMFTTVHAGPDEAGGECFRWYGLGLPMLNQGQTVKVRFETAEGGASAGEIKLIDSPKNLKLEYGEQLVDVEYQKNGEVAKETFSTILEDDKVRLQKVIAEKQIQSMHTKEATLEEIFIKVTGRGLGKYEALA